LSDQGLEAALRALASRAPVPVELSCAPIEHLPSAVETALYFVVAEALTNVAKYAHADHATVSLTGGDGTVVVEVTDDGRGGADLGAGSGLRGLHDRLAALDGHLELHSPAGSGTRLQATIPLNR
jgi:signal transduction histidine kinase